MEGLGGGQRTELEGARFDHVVDIDADTPQGPQMLKLGFNNTCNPFTTADQFCAKHGLSSEYREQIMNFIMQKKREMGFAGVVPLAK